jgi:hypothetical protein
MSGLGSHLRSNIGITLILNTTLVIVALVVGSLVPSIGWLAVTAALVFTLALLLGATYLYSTATSEHIQSQLSEVLERYTTLLEQKEFTWLLTEKALVEHERRFKGTQVWVASATLEHDVRGGLFAQVVSKNLVRGVNYVYIVPGSAQLSSRIAEVEQMHHKQPGELRFVRVTADSFDNITDTNIVIYNPIPASTEMREAYVELPVDPDPGKRYWTKVHDDYAYRLVSRIQLLIE